MSVAIRQTVLAILALVLAAPSAWAGEDAGDELWVLVETIEVQTFTAHALAMLREHKPVEAIGFEAQGGDIRCTSMEIWLADGRQQFVPPRILHEGTMNEFDIEGTNHGVDRVVLNCRPIMGVDSLRLDVFVR